MSSLTFAQPEQLWWLAAPVVLVLLWLWRFARRRTEIAALRRRRTLPVGEELHFAGDLSFWGCQLLALTLIAVALAHPQAPASIPRRPGLDIVVLQDASASMRVTDVSMTDSRSERPVRDRWQRSMRFLRRLGDALSWRQDRIAMAIFAHIAAPQIRLTRDPNALFFFLDHLHSQPPFRLEDDSTWDTNLELGIAWGMRIVEKDEELRGRSPNPTVFVVLTDGETWSGEVAKALARVAQRGIPVHVIGVGTLGGGLLPAVQDSEDDGGRRRVSRLERAALQRIAASGHGQYFELDRDGDRYIANAIVSSGRRLRATTGVEESADQLYWWFLLAAAACSLVGIVLVRRLAEAGLLFAGAVASVAMVGPLLW